MDMAETANECCASWLCISEFCHCYISTTATLFVAIHVHVTKCHNCSPSLVIVTSVVTVTIVILVITAPTVAVVADSYWILPLCFVP